MLPDKDILIVIFSKNRVFQLDATIRGLIYFCDDLQIADLNIIYQADSPRLRNQYKKIASDYIDFNFIREKNFQFDLLKSVKAYKYILFLVDDNIFISNFSLNCLKNALDNYPDALGFSLRLGTNTRYCYMLDRKQKLPEFKNIDNNYLIYDWKTADGDFGYPLELSSSFYRSQDLYEFLKSEIYDNPNQLEYKLSKLTENFKSNRDKLFCFQYSVVFSNPLNVVQKEFINNRFSGLQEFSINNLNNLFENGRKLDIKKYRNYLPESVHQVSEIYFENSESQEKEVQDIIIINQPKISVIIPCYNQAHYLEESVNSIINQKYQGWELIIVNDGSIDATSVIAKKLIYLNPDKEIYLLEKKNGDLADARNAGIRKSSSDWLLMLDSDDYFEAEFLSESIKVMNKLPDLNIITSNFRTFSKQEKNYLLAEYSPEEILENNCFIYASLYKKELWNFAGGYIPFIPWGAEDWEFWISCSAFGLKPYKFNHRYFRYRVDSENSKFQKMQPYFSEVKAMIKTLHPELYPEGQLQNAHEIIADMKPETLREIRLKNMLFPDYSIPYFWIALFYEKKGSRQIALENYHLACELAKEHDWQAFLRLSYFYHAQNDYRLSRKFFEEARLRKKLNLIYSVQA